MNKCVERSLGLVGSCSTFYNRDFVFGLMQTTNDVTFHLHIEIQKLFPLLFTHVTDYILYVI